MSPDRTPAPAAEQQRLERERYKLARRIHRALATPMTVLAFVWLVLLVVDLTSGLPPFLQVTSYVIWGVFVVQYLIELLVAPRKLAYIRRHWLTAIALVLPAARLVAVFRAARVLTALRGARLVRVVASTNRGMRALGSVMGRRGMGYAVTLWGVVAFAGAAGMDAFERGAPGSDIHGFGSALWWTAMTLTTMGTSYFPQSAEGRLLCLLLAIFAFAVFGYVTASIASFFVARDADRADGDLAGARQMKELREEIARLHQRLDGIATALARRD